MGAGVVVKRYLKTTLVVIPEETVTGIEQVVPLQIGVIGNADMVHSVPPCG